MSSEVSVSVIIPIYQGGKYLPRLLEALREQSLDYEELLLVVTDSTHEIEQLARSAGAIHINVDRARFDHAGTRSEAAVRASGDVIVFLTQDVLPASNSTLQTLVESLLREEKIGAAYGRQIPDETADPVAVVKRIFNYPDTSYTKSAEDLARFGLRTPFLSNAFAAYRWDALEEIECFGCRELICEDVLAGARLLSRNWSIHYEADAVVRHTHHFSLTQESRRYFDIGVAHERHHWIIDHFGGSDREGMRYLSAGLKHLRLHHRRHDIPVFLFRGLTGRIAYFLGRHYRVLPLFLRRALSSFPGWWDRPETEPNTGDSQSCTGSAET